MNHKQTSTLQLIFP